MLYLALMCLFLLLCNIPSHEYTVLYYCYWFGTLTSNVVTNSPYVSSHTPVHTGVGMGFIRLGDFLDHKICIFSALVSVPAFRVAAIYKLYKP
jgi:hypothetical protein